MANHVIDRQPKTLIPVFGWRSMTWFAMLAIPLAFLTFFFRESKKFEEYIKCKGDKPSSIWLKLRKVFTHKERKPFFVIFLTSFLLGLSYILFALGEPYFALTKGYNTTDVSTLILMMGIGAILGYLITAFLLDHLGRKPTIYLYLALIFLSVLLIVLGDYTMVFISVIIFSAFFWGLSVALRIVTIELFPTDIRGVGTGIRAFFFAFGFTIGSISSGFLSPFIGLGGVFLAVSAIALIIIPLIFFFIKETKGIPLELT